MLGTVDAGCHACQPPERRWYVSLVYFSEAIVDNSLERAKVRRAMEKTLLKTAMKIVTIVNREKDHIPPITVSETNPFPYTIVVNPKGNGSWAGGWA